MPRPPAARHCSDMTSMTGPYTPPPSTPTRLLRRSTNDRVAVGVCGGLGEYFRLDPVIFRVLFAVTAFLGIGIVGYLLAWVVMPEQGAVGAPADRVVAELRRRHVPVWLVIAVAAVAGWALMFSWWRPWPLFPLLIAAAVIGVALYRRPRSGPDGLPSSPPAAPAATGASGPGEPMNAAGPSDTMPIDLTKTPEPPRSDLSAWLAESREASRRRRNRAAPLRWITLSVLLTTLAILAIIDATSGVPIQAYFIATLAIVAAGLLVGLILQRTSWALTPLLIPALAGTIAFAGTAASLHDGSGDLTATPRSANTLSDHYYQAFGRTTLDLTQLPTLDAARTVHVRQAGGQVRLILPASMSILVHGKVHFGVITYNGQQQADGAGISHDVEIDGTGPQLQIDADVNAGQLLIERR